LTVLTDERVDRCLLTLHAAELKSRSIYNVCFTFLIVKYFYD